MKKNNTFINKLENIKICFIAAFMMWGLVFVWIVNKSVNKLHNNASHKHSEHKQEELEKLVELRINKPKKS